MNTPKNTKLRGNPLISAASLPESWFTAESEPPPVDGCFWIRGEPRAFQIVRDSLERMREVLA